MMEVCWVSTPVSQMEEARYGKEPGWLESMARTAANALADRILREGRAVYRRIEPTEEDLRRNPTAPIKHQWSIGLESSLDEIKAREKQIEEARLAGRAEAAAICREAADRYHRLTGGCAGVIASALADAAKAIEQK